MSRRILFYLLPVFLFILFAGCQSSSESASGSRSDYLTLEEINSVSATNMYDVVNRLRPRWLRVRGGMSSFTGGEAQIVIFMGNTRLGFVDQLRQVSPEQVQSARYLDSSQAQTTLSGIGSGHVAGAIVLNPD